jgi:hypothetical protein
MLLDAFHSRHLDQLPRALLDDHHVRLPEHMQRRRIIRRREEGLAERIPEFEAGDRDAEFTIA